MVRVSLYMVHFCKLVNMLYVYVSVYALWSLWKLNIMLVRFIHLHHFVLLQRYDTVVEDPASAYPTYEHVGRCQCLVLWTVPLWTFLYRSPRTHVHSRLIESRECPTWSLSERERETTDARSLSSSLCPRILGRNLRACPRSAHRTCAGLHPYIC